LVRIDVAFASFFGQSKKIFAEKERIKKFRKTEKEN